MSGLLLVGWDAADWKVIKPLLAQGEMPNLAGLIARGVHGNLLTIHPPLSPMVWTSIATGKRPPRHGIFGFTEPTADGLTPRQSLLEYRPSEREAQHRGGMVAVSSRGTGSRRHGVGPLRAESRGSG